MRVRDFVVMPLVCVALCAATHFTVKAAIKKWPKAAYRASQTLQGKSCETCAEKAARLEKEQEAAKAKGEKAADKVQPGPPKTEIKTGPMKAGKPKVASDPPKRADVK